MQTSLVRQEEKSKLERKLVAKESELFSVRNQLQEVSGSVVGVTSHPCGLTPEVLMVCQVLIKCWVGGSTTIN